MTEQLNNQMKLEQPWRQAETKADSRVHEQGYPCCGPCLWCKAVAELLARRSGVKPWHIMRAPQVGVAPGKGQGHSQQGKWTVFNGAQRNLGSSFQEGDFQ